MCVCDCVRYKPATQVFSPRPPRYHQLLSPSFIKRCRCAWAWPLCRAPAYLLSTHLFPLLFHSPPLQGLRQPNSQEGWRRCKCVHPGGACWCRERERKEPQTVLQPLPYCFHPVTKNPPWNRINLQVQKRQFSSCGLMLWVTLSPSGILPFLIFTFN